MICRRLLAATFALLACATAHAEVKETVTYSYYTVNVRQNQSLLSAVTNASTIREGSETYFGHVKWDVFWEFSLEEDKGTCKLDEIEVKYTATITLPKLGQASTETTAVFEKFVRALREHEMGHYQNGKDAARTIERDLRKTPPMKNCKALESQAHQKAHQTIKKHNDLDIEYDKRTDHGVSQGATLGDR